MPTRGDSPLRFDSVDFHLACQNEIIIPNVKPNTRNSNPENEPIHQKGNQIFDDLLYTDRSVILRTNS
jgi:hypothetical protein